MRSKLNRQERATCRVLAEQGLSNTAIAKIVRCNYQTVEKCIRNLHAHPDNVDSDYDHFPNDLKARYPRRRSEAASGARPDKRRRRVTALHEDRSLSPANHVNIKREREREITADKIVVAPPRQKFNNPWPQMIDLTSASTPGSVSEFLQRIEKDVDRFLPLFTDGGVKDEKDLEELINLPEDLQDEFLRDQFKNKAQCTPLDILTLKKAFRQAKETGK